MGCGPKENGGTGDAGTTIGEATSASDGAGVSVTTAANGTETGETSTSSGPGVGTDDTDGSSTGDVDPADRARDAARLACDVRETLSAQEIPAPTMGIGFLFSEYPARFFTNFAEAEAEVFEGDLWCHVLGSACVDCGCPLNQCQYWVDPDGETRIHLVTRGIDHVEFYGTDESPAGTPGAPLTPSVRYDLDDECAELPQVWTPDPEIAHPFRGTRILCMHHSDDLAEVVFVRVP
jgi:hypothetical protein